MLEVTSEITPLLREVAAQAIIIPEPLVLLTTEDLFRHTIIDRPLHLMRDNPVHLTIELPLQVDRTIIHQVIALPAG